MLTLRPPPRASMPSHRHVPAPHRSSPGLAPAEAGLLAYAGLVLTLAFVTGGSSVESGMGVLSAELLALPLLLLALHRAWRRGCLWPARWAVGVAVLVALLPLLQLLPLSEGLWLWPSARRGLWQDLSLAGIHVVDFRWTLTPSATERDAYLLLPPLALFFTALALDIDGWRHLLWWVVALAVFTLLLAFVQIGVPQDSFLNPFPQFEPTLTGVFANKNHQASALAIGMVLALSFLFEGGTRHARGSGNVARIAGWGLLVLLFILVLPLVKSRAGVIIALVVSGLLLLESGPLSLSRWRSNRAGRLLGVLAVLALVTGIWAAFAWMQADADVDGSRWAMFTATFRLGFDNAPWGSGFGSFVPMFEQATHGALMRSGYVNNAHNDYVQWWFEGGYLAVLVLLAALAVLSRAALALLRLPADSRSRALGLAAGGGVLVLLLHSTVDYPLRTPALMSVAGLLAGILVAAAKANGTRST